MNIRLGVRGSRGTRSALALTLALTGFVAGSLPAYAADDGVTQVAGDPCNGGSSNPTFYSNNHRMAITETGRQIAVYDPHGSGLHVRWRDPGDGWKSSTRGAVTNGQFPMSDGANDRPASIAIARDPVTQEERAWIVWSGYSFGSTKISAIRMRRLTDLNNANGPTVGPETVLAPTGLGHVRVDLAFESTLTGPRGVITWMRRTGDTTYQLVTAWLSDLSDRPALTGETVHYTTSNSQNTTTLTPTPTGIALLARTDKVRMFTHDSSAQPTVWGGGTAGASAPTKSRPSAVATSNGDVLVAVESNTSSHIVKVNRFNSSGSTVSTSLETSTGYAQPSIATDGLRAWVVMVRLGDGAVVSRQFNGTSWGGDITEVTSATGGGDFAWPNLVRNTDTHLRLLLDGKRCPSSKQRNAVIAYQRTL